MRPDATDHHVTRSAVTRRALLAGGAATAGVAVLAACGGGSTDTASSAAPSSSPAITTPPVSSGSSSGGNSAGSSSGGSTAGALAALADLTIGEPKTVDLPDGKSALLTRTSETAVACFSTVCTHQGCTVKPEGKILACPCHGSTFEAATGKVIDGPASQPLPAVAVTVAGGQVVAG